MAGTPFVVACLLSVAWSVVTLPAGLRVLHMNVGNLDEDGRIFGPCPPGEPYKGGLCSLALEQTLRRAIQGLDVNVITLVELVSRQECAKNGTWCPMTNATSSDAPCCAKNKLSQPEQVLRILPPADGWTVACDTNDGHACIGVRSARGVSVALLNCTSRPICAAMTFPWLKGECPMLAPPADERADVSYVHLQIGDGAHSGTVRYVVAHPYWITTDPNSWRCIGGQYVQAFSPLAGDGCVMGTGDWNCDNYRKPSAWLPCADVWHQYVGFDEKQRFMPVFDSVSGSPTTPLPTWGVPEAFLTLDMFVAARGSCVLPAGFSCRVMGVSPNTTRLDAPQNACDHRAILCMAQ